MQYPPHVGFYGSFFSGVTAAVMDGSDESPFQRGTFLGEPAVSFFSGEVGVSISQHFILKIIPA